MYSCSKRDKYHKEIERLIEGRQNVHEKTLPVVVIIN